MLIEVRLRPTTPWRVGHGAGDRERVDVVYHSDALYSAVTHAMKTLGWLDEWIAATAQNEGEPAVRFSSLYPFIGKTRLIAPPKTWWPPANPGRLYTEAARLIPLEVVRNGIADESRWMVDGETGCMFHTGSGAPVKIVVRTAAAIDRLTGVADPHRIACLEFAPNAGFWGCFAVEDAVWEARVKSAFRLLADSGFGGEKSRGWGRAAAPEFSDASSLLPGGSGVELGWWLISLYSPHGEDAVDWSRGEYTATQRGGWTDSQAGVAPKKQARLIEEGSVLFAPGLNNGPRGRAVDVAPDGFAHPVYRAGFALAVAAPPEPVMRQAQPVAVEAEPEPIPSEPEASQPEAEDSGAELLEAEAEMEEEGGIPVLETPDPAASEPDSVTPEAEAELLEAEAEMEEEGGIPVLETPDPAASKPDSVTPEAEAELLEAEAEMEEEGGIPVLETPDPVAAGVTPAEPADDAQPDTQPDTQGSPDEELQ